MQLYYRDQSRRAFAFQTGAVLSRHQNIEETISKASSSIREKEEASGGGGGGGGKVIKVIKRFITEER